MTSDLLSHPHIEPQLQKLLDNLLIKSDPNSSVQEHMNVPFGGYDLSQETMY